MKNLSNPSDDPRYSHSVNDRLKKQEKGNKKGGFKMVKGPSSKKKSGKLQKMSVDEKTYIAGGATKGKFIKPKVFGSL